jgi:hypothetical protein
VCMAGGALSEDPLEMREEDDEEEVCVQVHVCVRVCVCPAGGG